MKKAPRKNASNPALSPQLAKLRARLTEAQEMFRAIRTGGVDTLSIPGRRGPRVFTLQGEEHAYRMLIESMNEGALTLATDRTILYANACFAKMVGYPLEQVVGGSFGRFFPWKDRATLRSLLKQDRKSGSKILLTLTAKDGSQMPVGISIRALAKNGSKKSTLGMVVTDMTEAHRAEEMLRALTQRVVQAQESERGRVALELHDGITQLLCAIAFYSQALVDGLPARDAASMTKAVKLREIAGRTAEEVERISHNLHPSVLEHLGLEAAFRDTSKEFGVRTGLPVKLTGVVFTGRLSADIELALYRILQEALRNVEKHAHARHVTVNFTKRKDDVRLVIQDDGVGFNPKRLPKAPSKGKVGLGLLGMRERATYLGGGFKVKSTHRSGTEIEVLIPTD